MKQIGLEVMSATIDAEFEGYDQRFGIRINNIPLSNNELIRVCSYRRSRLRRNWGYLLRIANDELVDRIPEAKKSERRALKIIVFRRKLLDYDNFIGGLKYIIDAARDVKFLADDRPNLMDWKPAQQFNNSKDYKDCVVMILGVNNENSG